MATSLYAALLGLMLIALSINVIKSRRKFRVGLGDNDHIEMKRRIRAQSNFTEYSPIFLILLGYAEYGGLPVLLIHLLGLVFLTGRVLHAYSILKAEQYDEHHKLKMKPIWRIRGMICTFSCVGLLALIILAQNALQILTN